MVNETRLKEKNKRHKNSINYWKIAFLILVSLIVGFMIWFYCVFFVFAEKSSPIPPVANDKKQVEFPSKTTKADLNRLLASYLEKSTKNQNIHYHIYLEDVVKFAAQVPIFGQSLDLNLSFVPKVVDGGNVELKLKKSPSKSLPIPESYVLRFIAARNLLPDWIRVIPTEEKVYLSLDKIKLEGDTKIRMNSLDLKEDRITFTLLVTAD